MGRTVNWLVNAQDWVGFMGSTRERISDGSGWAYGLPTTDLLMSMETRDCGSLYDIHLEDAGKIYGPSISAASGDWEKENNLSPKERKWEFRG